MRYFTHSGDEQLEALAEELTDQFGIVYPTGPMREQIIDTICAALELGPPDGLTVGNANPAMAQVAIIDRLICPESGQINM